MIIIDKDLHDGRRTAFHSVPSPSPQGALEGRINNLLKVYHARALIITHFLTNASNDIIDIPNKKQFTEDNVYRCVIKILSADVYHPTLVGFWYMRAHPSYSLPEGDPLDSPGN